jgi:hypothetical protein
LIEVIQFRDEWFECIKVRIISRQPITSGLALEHGNCLAVPIPDLLNEETLAVLAEDFEVTISTGCINDD